MRTLRSSTSAQITSIIANSTTQPASAKAFRRLPYKSDRRFTSGRLFAEELFHLWTIGRARLDRARPAHFIGLVVALLGVRGIEVDGLDAGLRLPLGAASFTFFP